VGDFIISILSKTARMRIFYFRINVCGLDSRSLMPPTQRPPTRYLCLGPLAPLSFFAARSGHAGAPVGRSPGVLWGGWNSCSERGRQSPRERRPGCDQACRQFEILRAAKFSRPPRRTRYLFCGQPAGAGKSSEISRGCWLPSTKACRACASWAELQPMRAPHRPA
jgi:hypothetical protein